MQVVWRKIIGLRMITSVMSIHAKYLFTQRILDFMQGWEQIGTAWADVSTETGFKILESSRLD